MAICSNCSICPCKVYPQYKSEVEADIEERPIMVIGESPTAFEVRAGTCMSGEPARILKTTMEKVGLPFTDDDVYFTTAVGCAIPKSKDKNKQFPKDAIRLCRDRLLGVIEQVSPKLLLVCGKVAWQTLTGNTNAKITDDYGRFFNLDFVPGCDIMPIMNPGVLIHSPGDYKPFLAMLQLAATKYNGGGLRDTGTTTWEVLDTEDKCRKAWRSLYVRHQEGKLPYVTCDFETTSLDYREARPLVLGLCYEKNKCYIIPREMMYLAHNFTDAPWKVGWQHGKYDKKVAWKQKIGQVPIGHDTIYMHYALDETSEHNLGYLSKVFLQAAPYKYKMNQQWKAVTWDTYPQFFEALCERAAVDCDYTFQLIPVFEEKLEKEPKLRKVYDELLIPGANFLSRVEQNGLLIDVDFLEELDVKYRAILEEKLRDIQITVEDIWDPELYMQQTGAKSAPIRFNPGSPAQMAWMVFDRLKIRPRIKKGRSTDKDILKSIDPMPSFVKKVLEYRTVQKEHSTYVIGLLEARDDDGRVRSTFNLHVTATGRLSSSEPNVQNQPSAHGVGNIRKAFIEDDDYLLAEIDYSGAELRWLAYLSKCPVLTKVFIDGRNLHVETAKSLYGPHYDKAQKLRAKAVNFGIPYGREAPSFVDEFNISKDEAERMIHAWLDTYYGARDYLAWCANQVIQGNYLETPFGRRRRFGLVSQASLHALQNEARNFPIQSSSSDLLFVSAMEMENPLWFQYTTKILNLIHDSILLRIPAKKEILMAAGQYADSVMVRKPIELFNCPIPFKTDFEIGVNWGELVTFNYKTGMIEEEEGDDIVCKDFDEWLATVKRK